MKESLFFVVLASLAIFYSTFQMKDSTEIESEVNELKKNFLITWKWEAASGELIKANSPQIPEQMDGLWKQGNISDIYFNSKSIVDDPAYSPGISFVLTSSSLNKVQKLLDTLILVKEGIVKPAIKSIGMKWLGRNENTISNDEKNKTFVVIWKALRAVDPEGDQEAIKSDFDLTLKYYERGIVENAYWDVQNLKERKKELVEDLIFFVRAKNEQDVRIICDGFSFAKQGIASYKVSAVGSFWLGKYKE